MKNRIQMILNRQYNIFVLYTIAFAIVSFCLIIPFLLRGNGIIAVADSYNQVFPTFVYIKDYIYHLLHGNPIQFDFRIGLGDDPIYTLSHTGVLDITSILCILLIPIENMEYIFYLSILLKFSLSGVGLIIYIRRYVKESGCILCGALLYTFQVCTLFEGLDFPPFLMMRVTLPFILHGVDELEDHSTLSWSMILGLLCQGAMGVYGLYIVTLTVCIYYMLILWFQIRNHKINKSGMVKRTLITLFNGILGIGLSGIVLIPSIMSISYGIRKVETGNQFRLLYDMKTIFNMLSELFIPNVYICTTTLSVLGLFVLLLGLKQRTIPEHIKYITYVMGLSALSPIMGSLMNGLSYSNLRWFFVVGFFANAVVTIMLDRRIAVESKDKRIYYAIVIVILMVHLIINDKNNGMLIRIGVFAIMALIVPYIWNKNNKLIYIYTFILVIVTGSFVFGPKVLGGSGYSANFQPLGTYQKIMIRSNESLMGNKEEFERLDIYDLSINASLIGNYYGTSEYFSIINKYVSEFYQNICISPGVRDALNILRGLDGRQEIISLLSVSEYMDFQTGNADERSAFIRQNFNFIPMGFTYNNYVTREEFDKLNPMEKESQLMDAVVLEETVEGDSTAPGDYENERVPFEADISTDKKNIRVYFPYEKYMAAYEERDGEIYIYIEELHGNADVYVGNKEIRIKDESYLYYTGIEEYWFNLTEIKRNSRGYYFDIKIEGETDFDKSKLSIYWHPINYEGLAERQKKTMSSVKIETNKIIGTVNCEDNEYLFLSVPYSNGWTAYVDGDQVNILRANIGFMTIPLEKGKHEIVLSYVTPGLKEGVGCALVSAMVILFIFIYIWSKRCICK